jgi:hypothetical protein
MLSFLHKYARDFFSSQNGEEGILLECVSRMGLQSGHAVEIGGNNGLYCSNTALLLKDHGWNGLFVEANYDLHLESKQNWKDNPKVRHQCCKVDGKNVNAFVKDGCDVLSIDTDGADPQIFAGLEAQPKLVIVEIDSSIPPDVWSFNSDGAAGYALMTELGIEKGYFLLCHTGNLIFIDAQYKHLFPEVKSKHPLIDSELYFNRAWLKEVAA